MSRADLEEYLPAHTLKWCQNLVSEAGFDWDNLTCLEKSEDGTPLHRLAYETLVDGLRDHFETGAAPVLLECDKPYEKDDRYPVADFQEKINELEELNRLAGNLIITERPNENLGDATGRSEVGEHGSEHASEDNEWETET